MMTWYYKFILILMIIQLLMIPVITQNLYPLNMMVVLILYSILIVLMNTFSMLTSLYSYMIIISIIGGMMIMFMYFTSMVNNQKMIIKSKEKMLINFTILMNTIMLLITLKNYPIYEFNFKEKMNIFTIYLTPYNMLTYLSIMYLFYCLILTMKMCLLKLKPLRKMKN